ncbi:MAG: hypothetical protein IT578_09210 [Verrucomicrobiae bacterium]|nr:hypothetical protein [Verrucomicrobiae bacterium]
MKHSSFRILGRGAVALLLVGSWSLAARADPGESSKGVALKSADAKPEAVSVEMENSILLSGAGAFVSGNKGAFMERYGIATGFSGGIEHFKIKQALDQDTTFEVEGRGLYDIHDYDLKLEWNRSNVGYVKMGYEEFRTWYDGAGGYFRPNNTWFGSLFNDQPNGYYGSRFEQQMHIDRGEAWFEAGLRMPDVPELTFRYTNEFRNGQKDSTIWGQSSLTGGQGTRAIIPAFRDINERADIFEGDLKHKMDDTAFGVGLRYEIANDNDAFSTMFGVQQAASRGFTQRERVHSESFTAHGFTETTFSDQVMFTTGWLFNTFDSNVMGYRIWGQGFDPAFNAPYAGRARFEESTTDLEAGANLKEYVLTLNLLLQPTDDFSIVPSLKAEEVDTDAVSRLTAWSVGAPAALVNAPTDRDINSSERRLRVTEALEATWRGIQDWVFSARGAWMEESGTQMENLVTRGTGAGRIHRDSDLDNFEQKYTLGAYWYPIREVNVASQYEHRLTMYRRTNRNDTTRTPADLYPAFLSEQDITVDDMNIRVTWRPVNNLTFVTRYDFMLSTIDTLGDARELSPQRSAEYTSHILSESITWSPFARWYMQANMSYARNTTQSEATYLTGSVLESRDGYYNGSFVTGYALTDKVDLQAEYVYSRADNFYDNSSASVPYGAGFTEQSANLTCTYRLSDNVRWSARYGFYTNSDETFYGKKNYDAHVVYSSVQIGF